MLCSWVTSCGDMGPRPVPVLSGKARLLLLGDLGAAAPPAPQRLSHAVTPLLGEGWFRAVADHSSLSWSLAVLFPGLCPATLRRPLGVPVPTSACDPVTKQHAGLGASSFLNALASGTQVPSSDKLLSLCPLATGVMLSALSTRPLSWAHPHVS